MRLLGGLALILAFVVSWSGRAVADDVSDAKEHYKKGTAAYALGHYADAAKEYEAAFSSEPDPALLYNAAQAHRLAGNNTRALELYQSYLRLYAPQMHNQKEIERHISDLKKAIAAQAKATQSPPTSTAPVGSTPAASGTQASAPPSGAPPPVSEPPPGAASTPPTTSPSTPPPSAAAPAPEANAVTASGPAPERTPVTKKAWFWATVGVGAVVVVGVAVGLGVGLGSGKSDPHPTFGQVSF